MPRPLDNMAKQPSLAPSAADLGSEAYEMNKRDSSGHDVGRYGEKGGVVPSWRHAEAKNAPSGQEHREPE